MRKTANQVSTSNPQIKHAVNAVSHMLFSLQRVDSKALAWPTSERCNQSIHNQFNCMLPPLIPFTKPVCHIPGKKKKTSKKNENNEIKKSRFFTFLKDEESIANTIFKNENRNSNSNIVSELLRTYNSPSKANSNTPEVLTNTFKYPTTTNSRTSKVSSTMQLKEYRSPYDMELIQTKNDSTHHDLPSKIHPQLLKHAKKKTYEYFMNTKNNTTSNESRNPYDMALIQTKKHTKMTDFKRHDLSTKIQPELLKRIKKKRHDHFINKNNYTTYNGKMISIKKVYKVPSHTKIPKTVADPHSIQSTDIRNSNIAMSSQKSVSKDMSNANKSNPIMNKRLRGVKKRDSKVQENFSKIKPPKPNEYATNNFSIERVHTDKSNPIIRKKRLSAVDKRDSKVQDNFSKIKLPEPKEYSTNQFSIERVYTDKSNPIVNKKRLSGVRNRGNNVQDNFSKVKLPEPNEYSTNLSPIERFYTVPSHTKFLRSETQPRLSVVDIQSAIFKMLGQISKKPQKISINESIVDMRKKQPLEVQKKHSNIQERNMQIILQEKMMLPIKEFTKKFHYKKITTNKSNLIMDNKQQTNKKYRKSKFVFKNKTQKWKHGIGNKVQETEKIKKQFRSQRIKKEYWIKEIDDEIKSLGNAAVQTNSSFLLETFLDTLVTGSNKLLEYLSDHPKARDFEVMAARGRLVRKTRTLQFGNSQANIDFDDLAKDFKEFYKCFSKESISDISQPNAMSFKPTKNKVGNKKLRVNVPRKRNRKEIRKIRLCNTETQTYESLFKTHSKDTNSSESSKSVKSTDSRFPYKVSISEYKISPQLSELRNIRYIKLWKTAVSKLKENGYRQFSKKLMGASSLQFKKLFPGVDPSLRNILKSALEDSIGSRTSYGSRVKIVRQYLFEDTLSMTDLDNISVSDIDVNQMLNYPYKTIFPDIKKTPKTVKVKSKMRKKKKAPKKNTTIKAVESVENPCCCICRMFYENRSRTEEPWITRMKLDWNRIELKAYMIHRQNNPFQFNNPKPNGVNVSCVNPRTICDQMYEFCKNLDWQHCSNNIFTEL